MPVAIDERPEPTISPEVGPKQALAVTAGPLAYRSDQVGPRRHFTSRWDPFLARRWMFPPERETRSSLAPRTLPAVTGVTLPRVNGFLLEASNPFSLAQSAINKVKEENLVEAVA